MPVQNEVRILTPNFIDSETTIASSNGGTTANLWDMDTDSIWQEADEFNFSHWDTRECTLTFTFKIGTVETQFLTNAVIMIKNNVREFDIEYWNGSAYVKIATITENLDSNLFVNFGNRLTSRIRLKMRKTINPNERKQMAELVIARNRITLGQNYNVYEINSREKVETITLGDGSEHRAVTRFKNTKSQKYGCRATFDYLSVFDYNNLLSLKNENSPFLWYPESDFKGDEIYLVNWINTFSAKYTGKAKQLGYTINMELNEV